MKFAVELRESDSQLRGIMLQEGRAASAGRREVFAPASVEWPEKGVAILTEHRGDEQARASVVRDREGRLHVSAPANHAIREAYAAGKKWLSVEFVAVRDRVTKGGVREVLRAIVDAAAMTANPEYDTTEVEVRDSLERERFLRWL